jgi:hypothetical protein
MSHRSKFSRNLSPSIREGIENARENFEDLRRQSAPIRRFLAQELRRQFPKIAAVALTTLLEMRRGSRRPDAARPRRRHTGRKLLAVAAAIGIVAVFIGRRR